MCNLQCCLLSLVAFLVDKREEVNLALLIPCQKYTSSIKVKKKKYKVVYQLFTVLFLKSLAQMVGLLVTKLMKSNHFLRFVTYTSVYFYWYITAFWCAKPVLFVVISCIYGCQWSRAQFNTPHSFSKHVFSVHCFSFSFGGGRCSQTYFVKNEKCYGYDN